VPRKSEAFVASNDWKRDRSMEIHIPSWHDGVAVATVEENDKTRDHRRRREYSQLERKAQIPIDAAKELLEVAWCNAVGFKDTVAKTADHSYSIYPCVRCWLIVGRVGSTCVLHREYGMFDSNTRNPTGQASVWQGRLQEVAVKLYLRSDVTTENLLILLRRSMMRVHIDAMSHANNHQQQLVNGTNRRRAIGVMVNFAARACLQSPIIPCSRD
jgi:hypothetical protein